MFVNKDKKDRKRRGIVAQTPASSKRHQVGLWKLQEPKSQPGALPILLQQPALHKERNPLGIGALAGEPLGEDGRC